MEQLNAVADPAQYKAFKEKEVLLGTTVVTVHLYQKHSQSGSYERGFKYTDSIYGYLSRQLKTSRGGRPIVKYSPDHGKTWFESIKDAQKQRAGKVLVERDNHKEFAFEGIQKINRDYDPQYKWRP